jgi:hypothetical protein
MGVDGQHHTPAVLPPGKTRYPLYRKLGGSQNQSGQVLKISPPPGFNPRIVQPIASRYNDWAISAPVTIYIAIFNIYILALSYTQISHLCLMILTNKYPLFPYKASKDPSL